MKKYAICFLLFIAAAVFCFLLAYGMNRYRIRQEPGVPNTVIETETVNELENQAAAAKEQVRPVVESAPEHEFYLVSEAGFLLVFSRDKTTICLYTHIPITDFPEAERARLMEGIWFPTMMDVYNYLESYTS